MWTNISLTKCMLYIVATPIGNLKDVGYRAIEVLKTCDYILCEDTRTSLVFLKAYDINKKLVSYHKFNENSKCEKIANDVRDGKNIALISDAGMPGISDPGAIVINYFKNAKLPFTVIPGASALINAFVLSGYNAPFTFVGFLPEKKKDQKDILSRIANSGFVSIYYVSPHSINDFFHTTYEFFGDREVCVVRELTKKFEEVSYSTLSDGYKGVVKGEFVCVIQGQTDKRLAITEEQILENLTELISQGLTKKEAIACLCEKFDLKKNTVYKLSLKNM